MPKARALAIAGRYVVSSGKDFTMTFRRELAACALLLSTSFPAAAQTHRWDFSTSGVVNDIGSAGSANGALIGGATVSGGVLNLDGTGYVQFSSHLVPTVPSYTVALFARAAAGAHTSYTEFISQGFSGPGFYIGLGFNGSNMRATDAWSNVPGATFIADNAFHHYALTATATNAFFYIDGTLIATRGSAFPTTTSGGSDTRLGRQFDPYAEFFRGALDDVRIYDRALTGTEVDVIANAVVVTPEPATFALLVTGFGGIAFIARRRRTT